MNSEQFDQIVENRIKLIREVLTEKAKEYSYGDRLYNFKRAGTILQIPPSKALLGMFVKHLVSVLDLAETKRKPTEHMINEKIGDAINYLILLEAVLSDEIIDNKISALIGEK
jgi:hypothetical protein